MLRAMSRAIFEFVMRVEQCDFDHSILLVFKKTVSLFYTGERETMSDERCGIDKALFYEFQDLCTVAAVHSSCLECEVLAYDHTFWFLMSLH